MPDNKQSISQQLLQLQTTLNHVEAYVYTKDIEGRYTYVNHKVLQLFNKNEEAVIGHREDDFFDADSAAIMQEHNQQVLQQGKVVEAEEKVTLLNHSQPHIFLAVKSPLFDDKGNITGMCGVSTDITEVKQMQHEAEQQKNLLDTVLDHTDSYIYMKDKDFRFLYVNAKMAELLQLPQDKIIGQKIRDILPDDISENFDVLDSQVLRTGRKAQGEENIIHHDGEIKHYWSTKIPLRKNSKVYALVGISTDISEVVRLKEDFKQLANSDSLTGICNRRYLMERGKVELQRAQRHKQALSVVVFDIDNFKTINDSLGHKGGDQALLQIVQACRQTLREIDIFGRIGGDEFVIVAPETGPDQAYIMSERLRQAIKKIQIQQPDGTSLPVSCSFGIAGWQQESDFDQLLFRADAALYKAKQNGRNCIWQLDVVTHSA